MIGTEVEGLWLRRYHEAPGARVRLVCLPHAGGSASFYFPVSAALAPAIEVVAVQYPGRQDRRREACVGDLHELARQIHDVLGPDDGTPTALFGHSMGAALGFEIARFMEPTRPAAHLFVSGRRSPTRPRTETVHLLDDDGLLADVKALSGTDGRVFDDDELLRMALPAIRSDYRAAERYTYTPGAPLSCPISAFTGDTDPKAAVAEVQAWAEVTTGGCDVEVFPGGHFFLTEYSSAILATVSARLAGTV